MLVAAGKRDVVTPVVNTGLMRTRIPHVTVVKDNAGHGFLYLPRLGLAKRMIAFLAGR